MKSYFFGNTCNFFLHYTDFCLAEYYPVLHNVVNLTRSSSTYKVLNQ